MSWGTAHLTHHDCPRDDGNQGGVGRVGVGGELDGRRVYVQGMPRFEAGEEVVLFLNRQTSTVMGPTVGLWQGVFYVGRDKATGESFILDHNRQPVLGLTERAEILKGPKTPADFSLKSLSLGSEETLAHLAYNILEIES